MFFYILFYLIPVAIVVADFLAGGADRQKAAQGLYLLFKLVLGSNDFIREQLESFFQDHKLVAMPIKLGSSAEIFLGENDDPSGQFFYVPGYPKDVYDLLLRGHKVQPDLRLSIGVLKTSELGMELVAAKLSHEMISRDDLNMNGIIFATMIAQGLKYHKGLFGPLPLGDHTELRALVHTVEIPDSKCADERLKGQAYVLTMLVYDSKRYDLELMKKKLRKTLDEFFVSIGDAALIADETAVAISTALISD